ncbi:SufS family cysteine desulfurase [Halorubrum rubrum]|uniref:cysteine desulfurase n=1 Tax=Halorubrum rubrum TaxID=1126240 RepID=A0ABD5QWW9_9EURY|nr:SufS family cysteine desulfurase [Halorubrum rubrum]
MADPAHVRDDFPILDREVDGEPLVYLDNAATTQTPTQVYDVFREYYEEYNANVHRGIHGLSHEASIAYEEAHERIAEFVGASGGLEEIVFTKNATEAVNLVAYGFGMEEFEPGDNVVVTEMEHHASLVTWQQVARRTGAEIRYVRVDEEGHLDMEHAAEVIDDDTRMLSVAHVSNVLGTVNPVADLADLAHDHGALVFVDGAQSVPNRPVDVEALDADFLAFSGHKMAGPTGIGVLYGKRHVLEEMEPFLYGGEMIRHVTFEGATWNRPPWKFEAGTPPIAEGIALAAAADYLDEIGMDAVAAHENDLAQYAMRRLEERDDVAVYGVPRGEERSGLVSFNVDGVHGHDLSSVLNDRGIAVRAGDHCTQPLHDRLEIPGSVRASFYVYNTEREVDALIDALENARQHRDDLVASDRFHDRFADHYRAPRNAGSIADPTFTKHSAETSCGDDGEFFVEIDDDGTVADIGFESESCAVSTAVASMVSEALRGEPIERALEAEEIVEGLVDGHYPDLRRDCVRGPGEVIAEAARDHLDARRPATARTD